MGKAPLPKEDPTRFADSAAPAASLILLKKVSLNFNFRLFAAFTACLMAALFCGCQKNAASIERVAILPANVLLNDASQEWLKSGIPLVLQYDLLTAHSLVPGSATDESEALRNGATRILRTSVENRSGSIHVECTLSNPATHKVVAAQSFDAPSLAALLPALNAVARHFDPHANSFSTSNVQAWQALAVAGTNNNPQQRAQFLNQAINLDQNFGLAWVSLLDMIVPGKKADLQHMIDDAQTHEKNFTPYDRAKFALAMNRLNQAAPAAQVNAAQTALALAPLDLDVLATLGNSQILNGDWDAGVSSLRRALAANPGNVGLRFQLARGLLAVHKFKESEDVFNTIQNLPAVYLESATCILLQGDKTRANAVIDKFISTLQNNDLKPLLKASWLASVGDRAQAIQLLSQAKWTAPNIQSIAQGEIVIWQALSSDFAAAQKTAASMDTLNPQTNSLTALARLLADKDAPVDQWRKQMQDANLPDTIRQPALAYGLFLRGNFPQAAAVWREIDTASHSSDLHARAMLASSLDRAGDPAAKKINVLAFSPELTDLYAAVSFTEMRRLIATR